MTAYRIAHILNDSGQYRIGDVGAIEQQLRANPSATHVAKMAGAWHAMRVDDQWSPPDVPGVHTFVRIPWVHTTIEG